MGPRRNILMLLSLLALNPEVQGQNPYALPADPIQQGTVPDSTGYNDPAEAIGTMPVSNDLAPLIDLTGDDSPPPTMATTGATATMTPQQLSTGAQMGEKISRSRVIEEYKPEKFKVYPDDPDSPWWETNVRFSFNRAQREMKPMLLLFTAVWRPEAMDLSQEVFATKSFNEFVKENLVICYLNYPPNIRDAPKSMQWAKKEFKVAGYPSVLIFSPEGEVERSLRGYRKGRPVDYFEELKAACAPTLASIKDRKESFVKHGYRDWHNTEGRGLFAIFVRRDDYLMTLRDGKGQEWTVAISQLAREDQLMGRSYPRLDQVIPPEAR